MTNIPSIIAQIRELLPKVTPGPWRHHVPDRGYCIDYIVTDAPEAKDNTRHSDYIAETQNTMGPRGSNCFEHDAAWIALLDPIAVTALLDRIDELERAADPVAWQFRYMSAANEWTSWRECSQSRYDNRQQDAAFRNGRVEFRELFTSPAAAALKDRLEATERELASSQYHREAGVEEINRLTKHIADLEENLSEAEKDTHYWVCERDKLKKALETVCTAIEREPVCGGDLDYPHGHNDWLGWRKKIMRPAAELARAALAQDKREGNDG